IKFDFTDKNAAGEEIGVLFNSIGLLDLDEHKLPEFMVKFAGGDELIKFKFNERDANKQSVGNRTEMLTLERSEYVTQMTRQRAYNTKKKKVTDENSLRTYDFDFGDKRVTEFYVNLSGSGAITDLNYYREDTPNFSRKVPEPTSILSLAAMSALAASSLKRKRKCQISN
ncbi:MAG: PEP-CTERM sorting domain-containing protein, partial [Cyanobacteria bacterium J06633_8]